MHSMSATEFTEWQEVYRDRPFGEETQQQQLATISAILANQGGGKRFEVDDFMPHSAHIQTPEEQIAILQAIAGG